MNTDDIRPAYADPDYRECHDPAEQEPAAAHWDLAFGCALSVGPLDDGGPLRVTISMSDREAAAGLCVRKVTAEQVRAFAAMLLRVADEEGNQ